MPRGLFASPAIQKIAAGLGISVSHNPVSSIVDHCQAVTEEYMNEYGGCRTPGGLLEICAQKTGTRFEELSSNTDLDRLMRS
jgi:hypothetical protein